MIRHLFTGLILLIAATAFAAPAVLTQTFESQEYGYSIHYPADWKYYDRGKGVVVFKGKTAYPLTVNIQTIYTKQGGGEYATVADLMNDFYSQVPQHTNAAKFLERKPIVLSEPDGSKLDGEQTTFTFREDGQAFKQWQIMTMTADGNVFQAWAYRAPAQDFDANRPIAEAMLGSWVIR